MFLLVANPSSQSGKNQARIDLARRYMEEQGMPHVFLPTVPDQGTIPAIVAAARSGSYHTVVAMGGDGTFSEVAKALVTSGADVKMGLLPTGTGNNQGRSFGLSAHPDALAENVATLAAGHFAPLDGGHIVAYDELGAVVREDWVFDSVGWGFSAKILRMRNNDRRFVSEIPIVRELWRDQLVYAGAALRAFLTAYVEPYKFDAEVTVDGETHFFQGVTDLIVNNTRYYASAWVWDQSASSEDGLMEVVPLLGRAEWLARGIVSLPDLPAPVPDPEEVSLSPILRGSKMTIRILERPLQQAVDAQIDGEEWIHAERVELEVRRHAIKLVVPKERS